VFDRMPQREVGLFKKKKKKKKKRKKKSYMKAHRPYTKVILNDLAAKSILYLMAFFCLDKN
jgi:hypothetical protein